MLKLKRSLTPVLLLVPFLTTGCLATKSVSVDMEIPPSNPIDTGGGVAFFPLEGTTPNEKSLATRLSQMMSSAMAKGDQGFKAVSSSGRDKIDAYRKQVSDNWDNFNADNAQDLKKLFGNDTPPTGFFSGSVVVTVNELGPTNREKTAGLVNVLLESEEEKAKREAKPKEFEWVNEGNCTLTVNVTFTDIGTGIQTPMSWDYETPKVSKTGRSKSEVSNLSHTRNLTAALKKALVDFQVTWVISKQPVKVPVFVGDGFWHMPWEGSEYPHLVAGFERMKAGQYGKAAEEFQKQPTNSDDLDAEMKARILYDQASALEASGQLLDAKTLYEQATDLHPDAVFSKGLERCEQSIENRRVIRDMKSARTAPQA